MVGAAACGNERTLVTPSLDRSLFSLECAEELVSACKYSVNVLGVIVTP